MRYIRSFLVSLLVPAVCLLLVELALVPRHQSAAALVQPAEAVTHTVVLPLVSKFHDPTCVSPFGVVMYGAVDDASGLQLMADAGAAWVTTLLNWSYIEPIKGSYDWSSFDTKAQNATADGIELFVLFTRNPAWAAALAGGPVTDTQELVDFAALAAERYDCDGTQDAPGSPCVHYWSFYAEPDSGVPPPPTSPRGYWGHNPEGYAAMLSQVAPAVHAADPEAKVLIGGVAYDWFEDDPYPGPFVRSFLTETLAALDSYPGGAAEYIDAVAFHFYPISEDRWPTIAHKASEVHGIMERNGAGGLPLICPEMGYWSSWMWGSSEEIQARRLVQMHVRAISAGIQPVSWYKVFDTAEAGSPEDIGADRTCGLLYVDGTPKPSYDALQTLTSELGSGRCLTPLGTAGVEGYVFRMPAGHDKTVLWATSGYRDVVFPYSCLRLVDTLGGVYYPVLDNQEGFDWDDQVNGQIAVRVYSNSPFYVEPCH